MMIEAADAIELNRSAVKNIDRFEVVNVHKDSLLDFHRGNLFFFSLPLICWCRLFAAPESYLAPA